MGSADYLKLGDHNAICDVCGGKFKASQLRKRWDNLYVCSRDFETRHPADFFRVKADDPSVSWTRPDEVQDTGTYVETDYFDLSLGGYTTAGSI